MSSKSQNSSRKFIVAILLLCGTLSVAHAEDDDDAMMPPVNNALWKTECGSCHVAFPPSLLAANSWSAVMAGLDKHFGSDASLSPADAKEIGDYLAKYAGSSRHTTGSRLDKSTGKPILRITETRWFLHAHDEISDRVWKNPKVKSKANCVACHQQADSGDYNEHHVKIPK
jgi:cytochrome c553